MDKLISIRSKLQAYKSLPQSEYRAIGEHLLPEVQGVIDELEQYRDSVKKQFEKKYIETVLSRAEDGKCLVLEAGGYRYISTITKEKVH